MQPEMPGSHPSETIKSQREWPSFHGSAVPGKDDAFSVGYEFVRALHHRVCQPITAIRCSLEMMQMLSCAAPTIEEQLAGAIEQTDRAIDIISSFRQLFEAECPASELTLVDVDQLMSEIVEDLRPVAEVGGCQIKVSGVQLSHMKVESSARLLRQAFWNVIEHCVTVSDLVEIAISKTAGSITLAISDECKPDDLDNVFDPFAYTQLSAGSPRINNLPLAVSQRILCAGGNSLFVRAKDDGGGRVFTFRMKTVQSGLALSAASEGSTS